MAKNLFNSVELKRPNRNMFDLGHDVKMSLNMGGLYPTLGLACIPGDRINLGCQSLLRYMPMVSPVMHRMNCYMHYFFVPARLLWDNWENWITNTKVAGVVPAHPWVELHENGDNYTNLLDYFGIPLATDNVGASKPIKISPMMLAAYNKIYNDYYRDENLVPTPAIDLLDDGDNDAVLSQFFIRKRAWEKDYFTAALPWAQKGDAVQIPLGVLPEDAPVKAPPHFADTELRWTGTWQPSTNAATIDTDLAQYDGASPTPALFAATKGMALDPTTINDLRRAFRLQEWLERNALGGTRYTENIWAHFGVKSSDQRLQRAEYIVGTKSPVSISEVLNTAGIDGELPQGNMAGHGVSVTAGQKYGHYFCEEHGYIIGIMSVLPRTAYQQGIPKEWLKINDFSEIFTPSFAHIGEQPVDINELYAYTKEVGTETFGYTPRYAEYKYMPSRVAGQMKSTLNTWTMSRIFSNEPALNQTFIECDPTHRIFAVTDPADDKLVAHIYHNIKANRMMPFFGSPKF